MLVSSRLLGVKQSDNVFPENLILVMKEMNIAFVLAEAISGSRSEANIMFASKRQEFLAYPSTSPSNKEERKPAGHGSAISKVADSMDCLEVSDEQS